MIPRCKECGSYQMDYLDEDTGERLSEVPEWLTLLTEAIEGNFPRLKWKEAWTASLMAFYDAQVETVGRRKWDDMTEYEGTGDKVFMQIAKALGAHDRKYRNYNLAFQNWYANQNQRNGRQPKKGGVY